jgi:NAD(P)-dependent dehydrogenase (short-subunit alcohol dehydrogenase family)
MLSYIYCFLSRYLFSPAQIDTPVYSRIGMTIEQVEDMWDDVRKSYPLRREGQPEDVARAIVWLASDESNWITGVNLKIDGGFLDSPPLPFGELK